MSTVATDLDFEVGERLRALREAYGLSQRALARRSGVANGLISMIELNRTSPSVATLKKILDGIPLTLADFFAGNVPTNEEQVVYRAEELVEIGQDGISYRQVGRSLKRRRSSSCTSGSSLAPTPASTCSATRRRNRASCCAGSSS